jgi:hypothetical protein
MQDHQEKSIIDARWLLAVPFAAALTVAVAGFMLG